eukprot:9979728-Alexandrium_andersonii.AAC.1
MPGLVAGAASRPGTGHLCPPGASRMVIPRSAPMVPQLGDTGSGAFPGAHGLAVPTRGAA